MTIVYISASSIETPDKKRRAIERLSGVAEPVLVVLADDVAIEPAELGLAMAVPLNLEEGLVRNADGSVDTVGSRARCADYEAPTLSMTQGSLDATAALAYCMGASLEVFTGSAGAFQCDPSMVPGARELDGLSFEEAAELSRFADAGLNPAIISPVVKYRVPTVLYPTGTRGGSGSTVGTRIAAVSDSRFGPVQAIATQDSVSMVSLSGASLPGTVGAAARLFDAVSRAGVSVLLITQSSTEYSISFCVKSNDTSQVLETIKTEFSMELAAGSIDPVSVMDQLAIITLIGDGMRRTKGIAGRCFTQLARADVNIIAIAQGSSERAISAVISGDRLVRGVRMTYQAFFDAMMPIDLVIVGAGNVGAALIAQLTAQTRRLEDHGVSIRLIALANSRRMIVDRDGLDCEGWKEQLEARGVTMAMDALVALGPELVNPVLVDCTASEALPREYPRFMLEGFHIVTPNKRGNTGSLRQYTALKTIALRHRRRYLYETTVGAGLPVIENLQNLLHAGDKLESFSGILSGSLSYLFGKLEEGLSFSSVVRDAMERGFTEPDPRDDLAGVDVARKVLILARETGLSLELDDIKLTGLIPDEYLSLGKAEFLERLPELDEHFSRLCATAASEGKVLRFVGSIENGIGTAGLQAVGSGHPLFAVKGGENALAFSTRFYSPVPLLLRGYGAGAEVTAAGVFADILRTLNWIREV
ncbi:MAG: bifunctional aspartate kinase/homoserine dehydrogenase I [Spirochaetales bacterium]|nr:bifunctional aspartate kinase/homoserine dehydrogenase I [Spirochaetales bacterium]